MSDKSRLIVCNWKMNGNAEFVKKYIEALNAYVTDSSCNVIIAPPFLYLTIARSLIKNKSLGLSAQTAHYEKCGAFTGDISVDMIKDCGANYVIIGHSERRKHHHENDTQIAKTVAIALAIDLNVIVCVGDNLEEHQSNIADVVVLQQLSEVLSCVHIDNQHSLIVAYEPIWAIGTGLAAENEYISEMYKLIRTYLDDSGFSLSKIIYGGSVNSSNIDELINNVSVDGFMIGNASLAFDNVAKIIDAIQSLKC